MPNAQPPWLISETHFDPDKLHHKETVFTIGNGYLGTRGAFEEGYPGDRPATLIHGVFDDAPRVHTELANVPNWLPFELLVGDERFGVDRGTAAHGGRLQPHPSAAGALAAIGFSLPASRLRGTC